MKHARADYDNVQDNTAARELAGAVLHLNMITPAGLYCRDLARRILGIVTVGRDLDVAPVTTNGTTRFIPADEPVFLIRGQDAVGGAAVRAWADLAEANGASADIVTMAREHAAKMDAWPTKKTPDLPPAP